MKLKKMIEQIIESEIFQRNKKPTTIQSSNPDMEDFIKIANSNNPYIETEYGLTRVFVEKLKKDNGRVSLWIEFINDDGNTEQNKVSAMFLKSIM